MYVVPQRNDYGAVKMIVIKCYVKQANTKKQTTQIGFIIIVLLKNFKMEKKIRTYSSDGDNDNSNDKLKGFYSIAPFSNVMI